MTVWKYFLLDYMIKFSDEVLDHGICFVGMFLSVYSIYFMIVDYVGILFFFSLEGFVI